MKKRVISLAVASMMVATLFSGCSGKSDVIKIGAIQPISGDVSAYGTQSRDAINMAAEEINAKGGVLGKKIEIITLDDENNPEKTKTAFTKLATREKVVGVIGALTSSCSLAIAPEAQKRKVIMISPSSTNENVTKAGDFVFRACYLDPFQGKANAEFALNNLKAKKAAVLFDNGNDYSKGLKDSFIATFKKLGGEVVVEESYAKSDKDFNAQLTKVKSANADVLFIPDYYSKVSLIAKQVKSLNIKVTMLGGDGWDEIERNAGDEVIGSYFSNHYVKDANDAEVQAFTKSFMDKYKGQSPNALAALAYDATYMLVDAIAKAGTIDSQKVRDALATTDKKFVTGKLKFDENRNPIKPTFMIKVDKVNGALQQKYEALINP